IPYWVHLLTTIPFMMLTCVLPLRPLKGWLVASQYFYKAEEGKIDREFRMTRPGKTPDGDAVETLSVSMPTKGL
ncbi:MAG: DUF983 domain-containing protein, partial [Rhizobium sp.]|nr:DUF983 domain-containing protein [Rhizobium sp.]